MSYQALNLANQIRLLVVAPNTQLWKRSSRMLTSHETVIENSKIQSDRY